MTARRKSQAPPDAFWIAEENYRPVLRDSTGKTYLEASRLFYQVLELVFPAVDERSLSTVARRQIGDIVPDLNAFYPRGISATIRTATPEQRKAMNALYLAVAEALEAAHQSGIKRGKSLLVQLAKGTVTTQQFNDCALQQEDQG
jgi:hypothetical protein